MPASTILPPITLLKASTSFYDILSDFTQSLSSTLSESVQFAGGGGDDNMINKKCQDIAQGIDLFNFDHELMQQLDGKIARDRLSLRIDRRDLEATVDSIMNRLKGRLHTELIPQLRNHESYGNEQHQRRIDKLCTDFEALGPEHLVKVLGSVGRFLKGGDGPSAYFDELYEIIRDHEALGESSPSESEVEDWDELA